LSLWGLRRISSLSREPLEVIEILAVEKKKKKTLGGGPPEGLGKKFFNFFFLRCFKEQRRVILALTDNAH